MRPLLLLLVSGCWTASHPPETVSDAPAQPASTPAPAPPASAPVWEAFSPSLSIDALRVPLADPAAPAALVRHATWEEGLMFGPCALPDGVSREQFAADLLQAIHDRPREAWTGLRAELADFELTTWPDACYHIGKYSVSEASMAVMERYEDQHPDWEGGVWCFDDEPFGDALAATCGELYAASRP